MCAIVTVVHDLSPTNARLAMRLDPTTVHIVSYHSAFFCLFFFIFIKILYICMIHYMLKYTNRLNNFILSKSLLLPQPTLY